MNAQNRTKETKTSPRYNNDIESAPSSSRLAEIKRANDIERYKNGTAGGGVELRTHGLVLQDLPNATNVILENAMMEAKRRATNQSILSGNEQSQATGRNE